LYTSTPEQNTIKPEEKTFDPETWQPEVPPEPLQFNLNEVNETVVTQRIGVEPEVQYIPEMIPNGSIIYEGPLSWTSKFSRKLTLFTASILLPLSPVTWFLSLETLSLTTRLSWSLPLFLYPFFSIGLQRNVCNPYVHDIMLIKSPDFKGGILDPIEEETTTELEAAPTKTPEEVGDLFDLEDDLSLLPDEEQDRVKREIREKRKEAEELEKDKTHPIPPDPYDRLFVVHEETEDEQLDLKPFAPRDLPAYRYVVEGLYLRLHTTNLFGRDQYWTIPVDDLEPTWGNLSGFSNYYSKSLQRYFAIQDESLRRGYGQEWLWFYFMCKHELTSAEVESYEAFVKEDKKIRKRMEQEKLEMEEERKRALEQQNE